MARSTPPLAWKCLRTAVVMAIAIASSSCGVVNCAMFDERHSPDDYIGSLWYDRYKASDTLDNRESYANPLPSDILIELNRKFKDKALIEDSDISKFEMEYYVKCFDSSSVPNLTDRDAFIKHIAGELHCVYISRRASVQIVPGECVYLNFITMLNFEITASGMLSFYNASILFSRDPNLRKKLGGV